MKREANTSMSELFPLENRALLSIQNLSYESNTKWFERKKKRSLFSRKKVEKYIVHLSSANCSLQQSESLGVLYHTKKMV